MRHLARLSELEPSARHRPAGRIGASPTATPTGSGCSSSAAAYVCAPLRYEGLPNCRTTRNRPAEMADRVRWMGRAEPVRAPGHRRSRRPALTRDGAGHRAGDRRPRRCGRSVPCGASDRALGRAPMSRYRRAPNTAALLSGVTELVLDPAVRRLRHPPSSGGEPVWRSPTPAQRLQARRRRLRASTTPCRALFSAGRSRS